MGLPPLLHGHGAAALGAQGCSLGRAAAWFKLYGPPHHCVVGLHQCLRLLAVREAVLACIVSERVSKAVSMHSALACIAH